ncbi:BamA/TamA family outer membrane protein [bacterium]|nr:BamA/TamA family outer membrane protein [bacterium]
MNQQKQSSFRLLIAASLLGLWFLATPEVALTQSTQSLKVAAVEIEGTWKTRDSVVLELLDLRPGDDLDPAALRRGRERLLRSGYFYELEISSRPGELRGEVILVLSLLERHRPYLDTGFGYRDSGGWYLNLLSLRSENTLGFGDRTTLGFQLGFRTAGLSLESWMPLKDDSSLALRLRLSALSEEHLWYEEEPGWDGLFDEYRLGLNHSLAEMALEWRPRKSTRFNVGIAGVTTEPKEEGRNRDTDTGIPLNEMPAAVLEFREQALLHGINLGMRLGEGGIDGKPGHSLHLAGRVVSEVLGAGSDFQRWTLAMGSCYRLFGEHDIALGLRAGHIAGEAPWYERFHIGGSYSLRGFRDHSLSPLSGHGSFWTASGEYRFPLTASKRTGLSGLAFLDLGCGYNLDDDQAYEIDYEALQMGMGYGIRYEIPWAGVLGFDVGFPVTRGVTGESTWYYLTLGHSF